MTRANKSVSLDVSTINKVDEYMGKNNMDDFSAALEQLVLKGLEK